MKTHSLRQRVLSLVRENLAFVPDWPLLDAVGHSLKDLAPDDPIRKWWAGQRVEELRGNNARLGRIEHTNAEFLRENGIPVTDDIDLNF